MVQLVKACTPMNSYIVRAAVSDIRTFILIREK